MKNKRKTKINKRLFWTRLIMICLGVLSMTISYILLEVVPNEYHLKIFAISFTFCGLILLTVSLLSLLGVPMEAGGVESH